MCTTQEPVVNKDRSKSADNKLIKLGHVSAAPYESNHFFRSTTLSLHQDCLVCLSCFHLLSILTIPVCFFYDAILSCLRAPMGVRKY